MRDLRALLEQAAGDPPDLPDIEMIRQRAHPRIVRRRAASVLALGVVSVLGLAGADALLGGIDLGQDAVVAPASAPPVSGAEPIRAGQLEPGVYQGQVGSYPLLLETFNDEWSIWHCCIQPSRRGSSGRFPV